MKKNKNSRYILFCMIFFLLSILTSCSKKTSVMEMQGIDTENPVFQCDTTMCIVLGEGFNSSEFADPLIASLADTFALEDEGGFIRTMIYPADFTRGATTRIFRLSEISEDPRVSIVLTVGAPDATSKALAAIRDQRSDMRIISLFPQDSITATEGESDIVLDFDMSMYAEGETTTVSNVDVPSIIQSLVSYIYDLVQKKQVLPQGKEMHAALYELFAPQWETHFFLDPETGIRSRNHFTLSKNNSIFNK